MSTTWNQEYYDNLNFFYWEPQHLGKQKNTKSRFDNPYKVMKHLREMEVTLNHQFNLFFQLLPNQLYMLFFEAVFKNIEKDEYLYQSLFDIDALELKDATQPDIFFKGRNNLIGVELKIGAKSSLEQVVKYAILYHFSQKNDDKRKNCHLLYIGKGNSDNLFKDKKISILNVQDYINLEMLPDKTKKGKISLRHDKQDILKIAKEMSISYLSYQQVYELFKSLRTKIETTSQYASTIEKLIHGMQNELLVRNLVI